MKRCVAVFALCVLLAGCVGPEPIVIQGPVYPYHGEPIGPNNERLEPAWH